jgi:hypothetical protein
MMQLIRKGKGSTRRGRTSDLEEAVLGARSSSSNNLGQATRLRSESSYLKNRTIYACKMVIVIMKMNKITIGNSTL